MTRRPQRRDRSWISPELGLTAMVDVVFLLLVFFVLTTKAKDILAELPVTRGVQGPATVLSSIHIRVAEQGYRVGTRLFSLEQVNERLQKIHGQNAEQHVVISCEPESSHSGLIRLLDACAGHKLENIAFASN